MEQAGTAFVQIIPSLRGFHQSIGRQLRTGMGQVGEQSGQTFTRRMLGSVNRGLRTGLNHTTRAIARAAQAIRPVDRAVAGLHAGLAGTRLAVTGMAGALTSMGQRAQTAISMARDGARNLAVGFMDSRAAASAFTGVMGSVGGLARRAVQPAITGVQNLVAGFSDSDAAASALTGRMGSMGGLARRALQPIADGARNLAAGFTDSQAAASAFTGRLGTLGGQAYTALQPLIEGTQHLIAGFFDAEAAASALTGVMGTIGGAPRAAIEAVTVGVQRLQTGAATAAERVAAGFSRIGDTARTALGVGQDQARLLSAGMRGVGVSASEAGTGVYQLGTRLQGTYQVAQAASGAASAGLQAVGAAAQTAAGTATRGFQAVGRGIHTATAPIRGLTSGLRGTISEATGLTGAMNTAGLAATTAFTHGTRGVGLFSAGLKSAGVSASESNSWMYRLGQTTTSSLQKIGPGFRSAGEAITSAGGRVRQWAQETTSQVGGLGAAFSRMGALGAAAIAAIGLGTLAGQVSQVAMSAATTEAQLTALYGAAGAGAAEVTEVMDGMNERFRGLDMGAMRSGAVSLAYMGLQGEEAVGVLERLEKATTATGSGAVGMERAFSALTKGVNAGKFMMGELNQISDAGIPIYDALSDVLGVSIPEAQEMASAGAIGLSEVLEALSGDYGVWFPALLEGADNISATFSGAWSTIQSTIVNGFANELVPLFDRAAPLMSRVAGLVESGFANLPAVLDKVKSALVDSGIVDGFNNFVDGAKELGSAALPAVKEFGAAFGGVFYTAIGGVLLLLDPLGDLFKQVAGWMRENEEVALLIAHALGVFTAALTALVVVKSIWAAVTWAVAGALSALGIPLIIAGIAALVAGIIYAYRNFDGFRETVNKVGAAIRDAALWIWDNGLKPAFDGIVSGAKTVGEWCTWLWEEAIKPAWDGIVDSALWLWGHLERVWGWITDTWGSLSSLFSDAPTFAEIGSSLQNVATDVTAWLGEKTVELGEWLKGLPRMVWDGLVSAGESLRDWYLDTFAPERLRGIGEEIAARLIDGIGDLASRTRERLGETRDAIVAWAQELPERVRERVTELGDAAVEWARDLPGRIRERLAAAHDAAVEWAQDLPGRIRDRLSEVVDAVREWAQDLPGRIRAWFDSGAAVEWVTDLKDKVVERVGEITDAVVEWAKSLPAKIQTAIDNGAKIKDWIIEWGPKILLGIVGVIAFLTLAIPVLLLSLAAAVLFILGVIVWELGKWLWDKFTGLMTQVGEALASKISEVTDRFLEIRDSAVEYVSDLYSRVVGFFVGLYDRVVTQAGNLRDQVTSAFSTLYEWAVGHVRSLRDRVQEHISALRSRVQTIVQGLRDQVVSFFANLRDRAVSIVTGLRDRVANMFNATRDRAVSAATTLRDRVTSMFTNARDWVVDRATRLRDRVVGAMETLRDKTIDAFDKARAGIKKAWDKVESITRKPVAFVVNTVYNDGIRGVWNKVADLVDMGTLPRIDGWATGGVLPGYTPGRDIHTFLSPTGGGLELSGGEAIMRPEWTRAVGSGFVNEMNRAARTGGISGVRSAMGFASGGIIPTQAFNQGGIWGRITAFGSSLKSIIDGDGLAGAARKVLDPLIETMAGRYTEGRWSEALVAVPGAIVNRLMTWFTDVIGNMLGGDGKKVADIARSYLGVSGNPNQFTRAFGMDGLPWCAMFVSEVVKEAKAEKAYNNIRSAAVASFANSSMDSVTGVGNTRPGDLAVYRGKGPGNWGHINIIADENGGTVGGNESNGVRFYQSYSSRAAKFMRPKFALGGIWNQNLAETSDALTHPLTRLLRAGEDAHLYDSGGWLMPGLTAVHNATGRPEAVLTPAQSDALVRIASRRGRGEGHTFTIYEARNARTTARSTVNALRDHEALHPVP